MSRDGGQATSSSHTTLRVRAFFAIAAAMLLPLVLIGWLAASVALDSARSSVTPYPPVYAPADLGDQPYTWLLPLDRIRPRLSSRERRQLASQIQGFLDSSSGYGEIQGTSAGLVKDGRMPATASAGLARRGYAFGDWWPKGSSYRYRAHYVAWRLPSGRVRVLDNSGFGPGSSVKDTSVFLGSVYAGLFLLALALSAVGAFLLSRGILRPVRRVSAAALQLADGQNDGVVPVEGPREVAQMAQAFNEMSATLGRAQEAEQSFLLSVSHELKTPLTAIKGYGETLLEGRAEPKVAGEVITKEAVRLQRLVQDVLDLGRVRKSSFAVRHETVDLRAVAREAEDRCAEQAREYGLDLKVEAAEPALVGADSDRVLQVVSNLVENALRCTAAGGSVTITVSPGEIRVADTGPGLTRDDLERAFERFYLYERYGKEREVGTGLGLAIVQELTQAMGGSVKVESALGVGTSFVVRLPEADHPD